MLLPQSLRLLEDNTLLMDVLPRRHRETTERSIDYPFIQGLIESAERRTQRLLTSLDELEREVRGCASQTKTSISQFEIDADPLWSTLYDFGDVWWKDWKNTLGHARRVRVTENHLTEEFREARRIGLGRDPSSYPDILDTNINYDRRNWGYYQLRRGSRHKWGQYLRSTMDWDWDLGACIKRLFKIEKPAHEGPSAGAHHGTSPSSPTIDMGEVPGESWSILVEEAHGILPKEVRIAYKMNDGRMQYLSFAPVSSSSGHHPISGTTSLGPSGGEQEIGDLDTDISSSDASKPEAYDDTPVEAFKDDGERIATAYDTELDEVRVGGDAIPICSLD